MNSKSTASTSRIYHIFMRLRIEHISTHINHISWSEKLPFLSLCWFIHQIFKSFINYLKIWIEEFDILQRSHTNLKMVFICDSQRFSSLPYLLAENDGWEAYNRGAKQKCPRLLKSWASYNKILIIYFMQLLQSTHIRSYKLRREECLPYK